MSIQYDVDFENPDENESLLSRFPRRSEGSSSFGAVFIIVNSALGAGILALPAAFNEAGGIAIAMSIQCVLMIFITGSLLILGYCADLNQCKTYFEVVESMCGKVFQRLAVVCIILYCFGCCITFFIIIGDQFDRIFSSYVAENFCQKWYMSRYFTITLSSILFMLPLSFPRNINFLKIPSTLGVFVCIYIVILVLYEYTTVKSFTPIRKTSPTVWSDVFVVIPVLCFSYQCHVSIVPVYMGMRPRSLNIFFKVVIIAMLLCLSIYTVMAVFGYLTFGVLISDDILKNYDAQKGAVMAGIVAMALKIFVSYPVLHLVGRSALDNMWVELLKIPEEEIERHERLRRYLQTIIWFIGCLILALFIPGIGVVISALGSLAAVFIFVFPGLCLMQAVFKLDPQIVRQRSTLLLIISCIFIVIGVFIFGEVIAQTITKGGSSTEDLCKPITGT